MENREIERKFLLRDDSWRSLVIKRYDIIQGYVCREPGKTVRLRLRTEADGRQQAFLTFKYKLASFTRFEWEREISADDFRALLPMCGNRIIDKTRYILPAENGMKWEIDEFRRPNPGLMLAEIELTCEDTDYVRPPFLADEVTHDPRYYNANMV